MLGLLLPEAQAACSAQHMHWLCRLQMSGLASWFSTLFGLSLDHSSDTVLQIQQRRLKAMSQTLTKLMTNLYTRPQMTLKSLKLTRLQTATQTARGHNRQIKDCQGEQQHQQEITPLLALCHTLACTSWQCCNIFWP